MAEKSSGFVSASLIILILVAAVIGAVVAIVLQSAGLDFTAYRVDRRVYRDNRCQHRTLQNPLSRRRQGAG